MREDQFQRLQELAEKLADRFLLEADPQEWPGQGRTPADMTPQDRGDSYWCKKNAMATGGVLRYTLDLLAKNPPGEPDGVAQDADLDRKIADAERRAADAVQRAMSKAAKKSFDERTLPKR